MQGIYLKFYVQEKHRHHGILAYEWLLEQARAHGIHGGSAFRAIAGYGRHGVLHEQKFFELAGELPVEVVFVTSNERADRLVARLKEQGVSLVYARSDVEFGATAAR